MLRIYNSLTRQIEDFKPLNSPRVGMYTCGPTVYDYSHVGHMRKYVGDDILRRVLTYNGYEVKHVMNITDVGHLVSDEDAGEDKLEKGAREKGKTVWEIAKFFEQQFFNSTDTVGILRPDIVARATEHIEEQIAIIMKLAEKGFTYNTDQAIYFDTSKFPSYTKLSGQKLEEKKTTREDVVADVQKKHPADFALWFFTVGRFKDHTMRWSSRWGEGFPGWHIECSAMSMKYLGETFDIHTGGVDHIPVHHTNEIAQSEVATGKQFVKYWVHHEFLLVDGEKMAKSKKNFYTVDDIQTKGFDPLSLRYLYLQTHYRQQMNFTFEALEGAQTAYHRLLDVVAGLRDERNQLSTEKLGKITDFEKRFAAAINADLNMPEALAIVWEVVKSNIPSSDKYDLLVSFDEVLGLKLGESRITNDELREVPEEVTKLVDQRELLRQEKKWEEADTVRIKIEKLGYTVKDTVEGSKVKRSR